jgi:predicted Zn-dependent protease DUF2268
LNFSSNSKVLLCSRCLVALFILLVTGGVIAQQPISSSSGTAHLSVTIKDITPKFLAFYEAAKKENASPERRWELWKKMYDFAAVPPTPEGEKIAQRLLNDAWPRYPSAMQQIRAGAAAIKPSPDKTLKSVAGLLRPNKPVKITLLVYVGGFEDNAFTSVQDGNITVAIPIESSPDKRAELMTHEFTHAVHISMGYLSGSFQRSIGAIVVSEGLATRVVQKLFPNRPEAEAIEYTRGWLREAEKRRVEILKGIRPVLSSNNIEDIMRFTMGHGPAGLEREAYYAGWVVVGYWLSHGMSFADIARIPEKDMPQRAAQVIDVLLASYGSHQRHGKQ